MCANTEHVYIYRVIAVGMDYQVFQVLPVHQALQVLQVQRENRPEEVTEQKA